MCPPSAAVPSTILSYGFELVELLSASVFVSDVMPAAGISALEHVRDTDGTYTAGTGGVGYSWQWWVVVFQFITLVGEFRSTSHASLCRSASGQVQPYP